MQVTGSSGRRQRVRGFFPLGKAERWTLVALLVYSALCFLPLWREVELAGMVLFGWLMALLMVLSPALTLFVFLRRERRR